LDFDDAIGRISEAVEHDYNISDAWRAVAICLRRLSEQHSDNFKHYLSCFYDLIKQRKRTYHWTSDGVCYAYEALIPMLSESERWQIADNIVSTLDFTETFEFWAGIAMENMDYLCCYRAKTLDENEIIAGLRRLLDMHQLWIEGAGHLYPLTLPVLQNGQNDEPVTWVQFGYRLLLRFLQSSSMLTVTAALRGLWGLVQVAPEGLSTIVRWWDFLERDAQEWILLLTERLACSLPAAFPIIEPVVRRCYDGDELHLKLQAWTVFQAYERITGTPTPLWTYPPAEENSLSASVGLRRERLFHVPGDRAGSITFSRGTSAAESVCKQLAAATNDDIVDIEYKLSDSLRTNPINDHGESKIKERHPDVFIAKSPVLKRLNEIVYNELRQGRWSDIPVCRLAQALLPGDDPFILIRSIPPAPNIASWPIDSDLDRLNGTPELQERLKSILESGLADDQFLLGGYLETYSTHFDVLLTYELALRNNPMILSAVKPRSTFNGRTFVLYYSERFEPPPASENFPITLRSGGVFSIADQALHLYPSIVWQDIFGWSPLPSDPTTWLVNGEPTIHLERFIGPIRSSNPQDLPLRQPRLQRWVGQKHILEANYDLRISALSPLIDIQRWRFER
jgi:hypothetical protein